MANERYHGPLITDGVSLAYIKLFPWISFFLSLLMFAAAIVNGDKIGILKLIFLCCTLTSLFSIIWSFGQRLFFHFQSFTYMLIALIVLALLLNLDFIGLMMFVGGGEIYSRVYSLPSTVYAIAVLLLFLVFCGIYAWYYLPKNQGKVWKINQWETYGAKSKGKKEQWRTNFGIAFGAVLIVPSLLTGYIENVFGVFLGLLFTATLPAVIVDAVYAVIYIRKYPEEKEQV